jgi:hypothetical protein
MHAADDFTGSAPTVFVMTNDNLKNEGSRVSMSLQWQFYVKRKLCDGWSRKWRNHRPV